MYATKDKKGYMKVSLTLTFKVNCQDQVIGFVFLRSLTLRKLESTLYIQPEIRKVIKYIFMALVLKVNRLGRVIIFSFFEIPDLRNVKIDTTINSAS